MWGGVWVGAVPPQDPIYHLYVLIFFFLILLDILLLLECTCLAVKMVKVPFLAGEGLADSQCLTLTA